MRGGRALAFAVLCTVCAAGAAVYVRHAARRTAVPSADNAPPAEPPLGPADGSSLAVGEPAGQGAPALLFRSTGVDAAYGKLVLTPLDDVDARRVVSTFSCERVDYAGGRGVCLNADRGVATRYSAIIFDRRFQPVATLALGGVPSRVRVSPDGRLAAVTVFVSGHSYTGSFSTLTSVIDLERGAYLIPDLEQLAVWDGDQRLDAVDRNFWGVTFASDSDRFFATVSSGGRTHLIQGALSDHTAHTLRGDVECPSLSPDNTRVAFKRRVGEGIGPVRWRLSVLRLDTLEEVPLAEAHSIDDQAQWLDNDHVMYALPVQEGGSAETNTWVVDADGRGEPRVLVGRAYSAVRVPPIRINP